MDENGDAPEHPAVRWYQGLSVVERFTIQLAASLFGGGALFAAVGFGLTSGAQPVSALLDRLGWSLMQLAGAIVVVQVVLHRRTTADQRLYLNYRKTELIELYILFSANTQICKLYKDDADISDEVHDAIVEDAKIALEKFSEFENLIQPAILISPELFSLSKLIRSILRLELTLIRKAHKPAIFDRTDGRATKHFAAKRLIQDYEQLQKHIAENLSYSPLEEPMRCVAALRDSMSYSADPAAP